MTKIVILYSELAEYSVACFRALVNHDVEVLLIHWPINPEAPFNFDLSFCKSISKDTKNLDELKMIIQKFNPDMFLVSGWMDKDYVKISRAWYGKVPTILSLDNHWTGCLKQRLAAVISPFTLLRTFSNAFVPGQVQFNYARKLGFSKSKIQTGFYSADNSKFLEYSKTLMAVNSYEKKRFIYLGRYVKHKGIFDLWDAFKKFRKTHPEWELWCAGTGDQYESRDRSDGIKHFGFVQPSELLPILRECSIYILPSHFEPWGVSVQEMAISGFPLLLSNQIGSREAFLSEGVNGYVFMAGNSDALKNCMDQISNMTRQEFHDMQTESRRLGVTNSPEIWSERLIQFLKVD